MKNLKSIILSAVTLSLAFTGGLSGQAMAAGSASLSLSPSGGNMAVGNTFPVTVSENSGADTVNVIEADLNYNTSALQIAGVSCNTSAFEVTAPGSGLTCGTSSPKSGGQVVGIVNFKVIAAGSSAISFASSSHIYRSTDNTDVWNGAAGGGSYSFAAPAPVIRHTSTTSAAPATTTADPAPAVRKAATKKPAQHKVVAAAPVKASNSASWMLIAILTLALAAVITAAAWAARHPKQYLVYKKNTMRFTNNNITQPSKRLYKQGLQLMPFTK